MHTPVITFREVSKQFRTGKRVIEALDNISLQISPGKVTGLIGPDGAGKTTLMRLACGLLKPDNGEIQVLGLNATTDSGKVQAKVGYMPQRFGLYEDLSVQENLDLYADLQGVNPAQRPSRYKELMHLTGLGPFTARLAGRLSGGMKQKLGLACVLVRPPALLLLDEPTVGVDPVSRRELWQIVYRQVRDADMSVLLSTAYLDEAERCDDVILLHQGQILGQDSPANFAHRIAGRTWQISVTGITSRALQLRLSQATGVLDALITENGIRVVTTDATPPSPQQLLPDIAPDTIQIKAVSPIFEDAFIAQLKTSATTGVQINMPAPPPGDHNDKIIQVENLERRFDDFVAVKKISFQVRRGEIFGLLGANGAGKSTTFRMLCGLLPASAGKLSVAGHNLRYAAAKARAQIGYMAQKFSLYGNLTVRQNLNFFASAYGLRHRQHHDRIQWALQTFELDPYRDTNAIDLPLGYKQRLSFATALMHQPDILFLDEPTSGVDPLARREFWARTNALAEAGVTVLITTHFMEEANYCDRLLIMAEGSVLAEGTPEQIKTHARSADLPRPTMEDAFIHLIEQQEAS